jgi:hypothetical protein
VGGLSPVTPQAVVTSESLEREKRSRAFDNEDLNEEQAARMGVDIDWVRQMLDDGATPAEVRAMIAAGQGGYGASDQLAVDKAMSSALEGNVTLRELIRLRQLQAEAAETKRKRDENLRR